VLLLLPPSETKAPAARSGRPVDLAALSFPELTATRAAVLDALVATSARPDALERLLAGPRVADDVNRNARLTSLPARPVLEVYRGVLYDALDAGTLPPAARRRAAHRLVVVSGLWGALRPRDRIPPYRMNVCASLVGLGGLEPLWRSVLPDVLAGAAGRGAVVDLRSSSYLAMGAPTGLAELTVTVRVLRERDGRRSVVSHLAKHTRGQVARHLLELDADPRTPTELAQALADRWDVELDPPARADRPWTVSVVTT
jgi:hypothetical protein